MMLKKDTLKLGLLLGFVGPLAGIILLYLLLYPSFTFLEFLEIGRAHV